MREKWRATNPYMRVLYAFNSLSLVGGTLYGLYYGVFLYKQTFSLSVLAIDGLLGGVGVWLGYIIGVSLIKRRGYGASIRTAFLLWALIALSTALITDHIASWFMLIALIKAVPAGMYGAVGDTIMLREVRSGARAGFFQLNLVMEFVASIILPTTVGALIKVSGGYEWAFVIAAIIYMLSFALRCRLPKPRVELNLRGAIAIFRRPLYPYHAANRTLAVGFNQLNAFALTIVPFLLLKDEFSMGLLTSVAAVVAIVVSLRMRKLRSNRQQLRLGYGAHVIKGLVGGTFVLLWTAPILAVWQIVGKVLTPLHDPVQQSLDIQNDSLILGKQARQQAVELNLVNNTLKLLGSTVAFGGFILITGANQGVQRQVLEVLLGSYALWRLANLALTKQINVLAHQGALAHISPHRMWLHKLRFVSYAYMLRAQNRFSLQN